MIPSDTGDMDTQPPSGSAGIARELDTWLNCAGNLASAAQATEMVETVRRLKARHHAPGFRVAFVGEFNRGKSTLINRLLGRPLLPVGDVPTTALVTTVAAGTPEQLDVRYANGQSERRPLTPTAWDGLVGEAQDGQSAPLPTVRVTVDSAWLRDLDAELVDTPGAGDLIPQRVAVVYDALAETDAAVFLISAHLPFSMTERTFLEQQVLGKRIDRVLVVVSQLDRVPLEERESVMQSVRSRVGRVAPQLTIISSQPMTPTDSDAAALGKVRALIDALAAGSDRSLWRSRQIAEQTLDTLQGLRELGETALESLALDDAQRKEALRRQQGEALAATVRWNEISSKLDERALRLEQLLRQSIADERSALLKRLNDNLNQAGNPKQWWDQEYQPTLQRELIRLGKANESVVLQQITEDDEWLRAEVASTLNHLLTISQPDAIDTSAPTPRVKALPLRDYQRIRLFSRLGLGAATIIMYLFIAPVAAVITAGTVVVSEQLINAQVKQQRAIIQKHMDALVSEAIDRYVAEIAARVRLVYAKLTDNLRDGQEAWERSKAAVLTQTDSAKDRKSWEQFIVDVRTLEGEIIAALAR